LLCVALPPDEISTRSLHDALPICSGLRALSAIAGRGPDLARVASDNRMIRSARASYGSRPKTSTRCSPPSSSCMPRTYPSPNLRSEWHTYELQSREDLVCRRLLEG